MRALGVASCLRPRFGRLLQAAVSPRLSTKSGIRIGGLDGASTWDGSHCDLEACLTGFSGHGTQSRHEHSCRIATWYLTTVAAG
jgi:hypothetical protein